MMLTSVLQVVKNFPEDCDEIKVWVEELPGNERSPVHPFSGLVINFNNATLGHRDHMDDRICLVLALPECEGGELVLYEAGIVLKLRLGDMVIFRSADVTHFNLHFVGRRASLVFNSDKGGKAWANNRNGWESNRFFMGGSSTR